MNTKLATSLRIIGFLGIAVGLVKCCMPEDKLFTGVTIDGDGTENAWADVIRVDALLNGPQGLLSENTNALTDSLLRRGAEIHIVSSVEMLTECSGAEGGCLQLYPSDSVEIWALAGKCATSGQFGHELLHAELLEITGDGDENHTQTGVWFVGTNGARNYDSVEAKLLSFNWCDYWSN